MAYDRYPRSGDRSGYNDRNDLSDYGQDYSASGDPYSYSSARDYAAAGQGGRDRDRSYGQRDYGNQGYGQRERMGGGSGGSQSNWGNDRDDWRSQSYGGQGYGSQNYGNQNYDSQGGDRDYGRQAFGGGSDYYRGDRNERGYGRGDDRRDDYRQQRGSYGSQSQANRGGDDDRGFLARAGDEVRSWFGDEEAERRREMDARHDERTGFRASYGRDEHYHNWRNQQIAAFDRDYDEYRQENQSKFHNEFASFRTERQGQRDLLGRVEEHAEVLGSDGEHVGTVDKVRGDRIILTKNDADAGGRHHSIPSRWLQSAESNKVTLRKTAAEAKQHWRDEERQDEGRSAMFGGQNRGDQNRSDQSRQNEDGSSTGGTNLNRSFSGTY